MGHEGLGPHVPQVPGERLAAKSLTQRLPEEGEGTRLLFILSLCLSPLHLPLKLFSFDVDDLCFMIFFVVAMNYWLME